MVTRTQSSPLPSAQNAELSTNQASSVLSKIQPLQKAMSMITGQKSMTDTACVNPESLQRMEFKSSCKRQIGNSGIDESAKAHQETSSSTWAW